MSGMMGDVVGPDPMAPAITAIEDVEPAANELALVKKTIKTIKNDRKFFEKNFEQMKKDMHIATYGGDADWCKGDLYRANIVGRHVKQKTAALYAKNPKAVARRRETIDFQQWDENPSSLKLAFQTVQQGVMAVQVSAQAPPMMHPETGTPLPPVPQMPPGFEQAQALLQDYQQGLARRQEIQKLGKTLEVIFAQAMREQKPVDVKAGMKQCVRRACTTGVGYVKLGFQRQYGPRPGLMQQLTDARTRLDHLGRLQNEIADGDISDDDAEMAELQMSVTALQAEPEIILREGLIWDFPQATKVIPDRLCRSLIGFIGARHLTIEYLFTPKEVEEMFQVDLKREGRSGFSAYGPDGKANDQPSSANQVLDEQDSDTSNDKPNGLVCVWEHYDKPSGLVYYVADGHDRFLRPPAEPDVFVEDFWPVWALTFNAIENEDVLFPPSDVTLLNPMQQEYNRSRQGKREHRQAARPRWVTPKGLLDDADKENLVRAKPFDTIELNIDPQTDIKTVLQSVPVPGVDPNLYDTGEIFSDIQLVGGTQEASYGGVSKATATESAIAANSSSSTDGSAIDDLDAFLTVVTRAGGQILLREMSEEKVKQVAGVGAHWPHMTLSQIADEIFLDVEAGSTGKPNQAVEINNMKTLLPFLTQMPGIDPNWLAKQVLLRLDDKLDLTDALSASIPSIVAQNANAQPGTGNPATDPAAQGAQGAQNGPQAPANAGSGPAFGSNQV